MDVQYLCEQILHTDRGFSVVLADTSEPIDPACRLRYEVYCVERASEPGSDDVEPDEFDSRTRDVLPAHRESVDPMGTGSVGPSSPTAGLHALPVASICAPRRMRSLPPLRTGEISRFAVSKRQPMSRRAGAIVRLGLMQARAGPARSHGGW